MVRGPAWRCDEAPISTPGEGGQAGRRHPLDVCPVRSCFHDIQR